MKYVLSLTDQKSFDFNFFTKLMNGLSPYFLKCTLTVFYW